MNAFLKAKPIWYTQTPDVNDYAVFEDEFILENKEAVIRIAADSHYALYVNGEYIYSSQFADDEKRRVYDEIDLSALVHPGKNTLRIGGYATNTDSSVYVKGRPYVIYEVRSGESVRAYSSKDTLCARDASYLCGNTDVITGQMGYTFHIDLTKSPNALHNAFETGENYEFVVRPIRNCVMEERKKSVLFTQGIFAESICAAERVGQRMQKAMLGFREFNELMKPDGFFEAHEGDGIYLVYDLLEEETGLMDVEIETEEACEIIVGWGEHLDDMRVRAYVGRRNFVSVLRAKKGVNRFFHPYRRLGLRYLQIHIYSKRAKVNHATVRPVHYPVPTECMIEFEDALHQKIYDTCVRTLKLCMHEHYEDCPWREQALYAMDSRNQMLCGYYAFGEYDFAKASLETLARSMREDHLLELCAPAKVAVDIPSFSMMYVVELYEYLMYSKDSEFVRRMLPCAEEIVENAVSRIRENGLAPRYSGADKWNFYEWSEHLHGQDAFHASEDENRFDAPMNIFLALSVSRLAGLYKFFGENEKAERLFAVEKSLLKAVHENFYDPETHMYASFLTSDGVLSYHDELTQSLCLYAGACPSEEEEYAMIRLTDESMTPVTLAYSVFKYEALLKKGRLFGEWVRRDIEKQWGSMLIRGATTFFETIKAGDDFDRAGSLCHGWSAVPAYLYFAYALGIKPEDAKTNAMRRVPSDGLPKVNFARVLYRDGTTQEFS